MKLFLKASAATPEKCAIESELRLLGSTGSRKQKLAGYRRQLREKQKVKRIYGVLEESVRRYFEAGGSDARDSRETPPCSCSSDAGQRHVPAWLRHVAGAGAPRSFAHGHFTVNGRRWTFHTFCSSRARRPR